MLKKAAALGMTGALIAGILSVPTTSASAAAPKRRLVISGTVYLMDDETWGSNTRCLGSITENDIVYNDEEKVINQSWSCGKEVQTTIVGFAELEKNQGIYFHGEVIFREGDCGCDEDPIRARKSFRKHLKRNRTYQINTGYIQIPSGDATEVKMSVSNRKA